MRLRDGARVAVIGAGPSGLVAAKHALEAGFDVTVFEASDDLGGQWHTTAAAQRRVAGDAHEHEPRDDRVLGLPGARRPSAAPLRRADPRLSARVRASTSASTDADPAAARRVSAGRARLGGRRRALRRRGRGVGPLPQAAAARRASTRSPATSSTPSTTPAPSASAVAACSSTATGSAGSRSHPTSRPSRAVVSAFRKPRYVIQKVVDGVSSDWQWYTAFGALERRLLARAELSRHAPRPGAARRRQPGRVRSARAATATSSPPGSRCARTISRRSRTAASSAGRRSRRSTAARVTFVDGSVETVDAIVCATGYDARHPLPATPTCGP